MKHIQVGDTYNYLKIIERVGSKKNRTTIWKCECLLCGSHKDVSADHLRSGATKSCGCYRKQFMKAKQSKTNNYIIEGDIVIMFDTKGNSFHIDLEDLDRVKEYYWSVDSKGYVKCSKERMFLHRFILNTPEGYVVDHKNHNTTDNRKCNIWSCTQSDNMYNQKRFHSKEALL